MPLRVGPKRWLESQLLWACLVGRRLTMGSGTLWYLSFGLVLRIMLVGSAVPFFFAQPAVPI